jgi:hypothetical protein
MDLIPAKLPELSQNSMKIFESTFNKSSKNNNKQSNTNKLYPYCGETKNQKIIYSIDEKEEKEKQGINMQQLEWLLDVLNSEDK